MIFGKTFMKQNNNKMKKVNRILKIIIIVAGFSLLASCDAEWVATIPVFPEVIIGDAPYAGAVWVGPEYYWSGGRYERREGHWEHGGGGRTWHGGSWAPHRNGYRWNRGGWGK